MYKLLIKYLQRIGVDYSVIESGKALDFTVESPEGSWNCMMSISEQLGVGFYSTLHFAVPQDKRTQVALYLMWLNNAHLVGNFELDLKTGDIRFKTYLDCNGIELTERAIDRTMLVNVTTMQKHFAQIKELAA